MNHLWTISNDSPYFEMNMNHTNNQDIYESWDAFMNDSPFNCNCLCDSPVLQWFWKTGEQQYEEAINNDDESLYDISEFKDVLQLVYIEWYKRACKIEIYVKKEDEDAIREFILEHMEKSFLKM